MHKLLIASKNPGKIKEIKDILLGIPYEIKSLNDIGLDIDVEETGKTFAENAILKAKTIGEKTGLITLADDSGLEVDALNGKPGIHSARYAAGNDMDRINKLLKELSGIPKEKRTARFVAVIVLYNPETKNTQIFEGVSEGYITEKPIGSSGFGYDPVFFNLGLGKTNAESTSEEKNKISHRARALKKCKEFILNNSLGV
ncbi:XTP/dITP diphosphatase [Candidatus Gottesmanbacteria bacterium]|nr:XTP/dITP diphosphatase [Candidatus Gottesmanbacteria bacterium]